MLGLFTNKHGKNRPRIIFTLADFIVLRRPIMCFFPEGWIWMGTFGVPQCPVQCNIGINKFRWMTFHFLIRCEGGSIQISEIPFVMYNYEWNSHLMGRFLLNISAIIWIAFVLLLSFSLFVGSCHIACFSHIITAFSTIISSLTFFHKPFSSCRGPPFDVQRTGSGFDPKGGLKIITWNCRHGIFAMLEFSLPQVTSNIVALAFSVQHFLAVGTLEKKVLGKEKHAKKHRFVVQRTWEYWTLS